MIKSTSSTSNISAVAVDDEHGQKSRGLDDKPGFLCNDMPF